MKILLMLTVVQKQDETVKEEKEANWIRQKENEVVIWLGDAKEYRTTVTQLKRTRKTKWTQ